MRLRKLKNKLLLALWLMAVSAGAFAQRAKYKAELPVPAIASFYTIVLPPQILAKANAGLSDIRIIDAAGKPVPYLFGVMLPKGSNKEEFVPFKEISAGAQPDTVTTFMVKNATESTSISQLVLKLRNMDVDRMVDLTGSDDLKKWYAIKEDIVLQKTGEGAYTNGSYEQMLNFPASNYHYFRIKVQKQRRDAVAILQAGIYMSQMVEKAAYQQLDGTKFNQKDSAKTSHIFITLADNYPVNQLWLAFTGAKFYKRTIRLYEVNGHYRNLIATAFVSSAEEPLLNFAAKTDLLEVEIDNEDNPPLTVTKVQALQLQQSLIAWLDGGKNYRLLFADSAAITPNYDLSFFADSVSGRGFTKTLTPGQVKENQLQQAMPVVKGKGIPAWAIWVAIAIVLALLAFLTFKMTREVGKRG